jgi:hypothetical protein
MWIDGKSSRQIAEALGGVTRNAVMGMVNRMGLMGNQAHNSTVRTARGACRPIIRQATPDTAAADGIEHLTGTIEAPVAAETQTASAPTVAVMPEPGPEAIVLPDPVAQETVPVAAAPAMTSVEDAAPADSRKAANDDPVLPPAESGGSRLARKLLGPIRRMVAPDRPQSPSAPAAVRGYVAGDAEIRRERRPDARTSVSMVQEITGQTYDQGSPVHRTALVAISSILAGGDPRPMLPRGFPEPVVIRTLRNLAEKGIMIAGRTPEAWLDPDLGDLNFFIDVLRAEGVLRTPNAPRSLTA